jgi:hypothetical protein
MALVAVAVLMAACAGPERPLLERFFGLSRLRDLTALQAIATVAFEPRQDGIVRTFDIIEVTAERVEGTAAVKDVMITAPVIVPDGETIQKTLVVTLRRVDVRSGRWMVTGVRDARASAPAPRP